ncbi:TMEM165/GDT1 family protein [Methylosarcina fibrata]|uniref:TMEM165/GDT1 family protein n=1 Tax=Methylosarcina fibrata TaxID=105972 RepID=UPI0004755BA2|nr:TMEM165/GDT1 family protein [Methylosarcina fibrata]
MDKYSNCLEHILSRINALHPDEILRQALDSILLLLGQWNIAEFSAASATTFLLIVAAEIGDKSQLVCMTLASRHRPMPVLWGAVIAFAFLNTLAVVFGAAIAHWLPESMIAAAVAVLFAVFGIHALLAANGDDDDDEIKEKSGHGIFITTFLMITVAEFGDKTQLAVVALSSTATPAAIWLGSTAALAFTSALGILAGRTILQKLPLTLLHKISGLIFLTIAILAGYRSYLEYASR